MYTFTRCLLIYTVITSAALAQVIPTSGSGVVGTSPVVAQLNTGVNLHVGGVAVSADRRYVGMNIGLSHAMMDGIDTFTSTGTATKGSAVGGSGGLSASGNRLMVLGQSRLMMTRTPAIRSDAMNLREAVKALAADSRINLVLSTNALKAAKVDDKTLLRFDVPAGVLSESLLAVLDQGVPGTPMIIKADNDVIYITTRAHADCEIVSKTYSLETIVARITRLVAIGTSLARISPADAPKATKDSPLIRIITANIRKEVWKVNGGHSEIIQDTNKVIITAPPSVHAMFNSSILPTNGSERPGYIGYSSQ